MSWKRFFIVSSAAIGAVVLGWVVFVGAIYAWSGVATVRIKDAEQGIYFSLPVPMAMVEIAASGARSRASVHYRRQLGDHLPDLAEFGPIVTTFLSELEECPDFTLVDVQERDQLVQIRKEGRDLVVTVIEASGSEVFVSVPLRSFRRTVENLANLG